MWYEDKKWWKLALSRALRSMGQGCLVGFGEVGIGSALNIWNVDWKLAVGSAIGMFIFSFATSIAFGVPEYEDK